MVSKTFEEVVEIIRGKPILVANRGIPARRISRSIKELRAVPIMTATDVDKTSPPTASAQELILLGSNPRAYLDLDLIIRKAKERKVIGIHPGWGFSAEDDSFPERCKAAGIVFIGPDTWAMHELGNKVRVRILAKDLGIPTVPGSEGAVTVSEAKEMARKIGYPVMLKAEGGGGGRGISEIFSEDQLESAYLKASTMAQASFGNPRLYVEKLLTSIRHIEIQVAADRYGNVVALDERDCTVQRNHQKLVEITPSPWPRMTGELRAQLKAWSVQLVKTIGYHSLCTVEFLVDADAVPYLVEVNTRLQVEHGITECRYGIDLVEEQIAIAFGAKLRLKPDQQPLNHAMQVRVNCEDPQNGFAPNAGKITRYLSPGSQGIRIDSCVATGYEFPSDYDSAAALLIGYGSSFNKVLGIMDRALEEYIIRGVKTTIPFHRQVIKNRQFRRGEYDTRFLSVTPDLVHYRDVSPRYLRNSRLIAEISAKGHNPYVQLGEYRGRGDKRMPRFNPVLPSIDFNRFPASYPRWDRDALLDRVRDSDGIHFTDTTTRDITQSNSGNRFRLAEDRLIGPYLDNCGFFSLENGGGAHFHVAMLANMTYPFSEASEWNCFAPKTPKQILIRSTNVLGYKPQPSNLMRLTGEMICEHYDVIRCFDFLNHIENMRPFAQVVLNSSKNVFEPALSLSWAAGFDVPHYVGVVDEILHMVCDVAGVSTKKAARMIILGLKDMAGVCPPRFIKALVTAIREKYPDMIQHYHRHYTDGLFVPAVGSAAAAGAKIVDTAIGASVRWYGQGEVLSTAAYIEDELGLKTCLNREMIRSTGFVLKQIMPYYDRYTSPYFQGIDYDVVDHGMPGGATSSSQEGAMKQGYIHLLPHMLRFLAGTRKIVRYHDVTPGSQITWNTAFLTITSVYKNGGEKAVEELLRVLETVIETPEAELSENVKIARMKLYSESNDAFRNLLLGKFGRLPLGFPPDWVYESAFGSEYKTALIQRTETSPLQQLADIDMESEKEKLRKAIRRDPKAEEFVMYLNHPGDALKTIEFTETYGNPNQVPLDVWFEGIKTGQKTIYLDGHGKPHEMEILDISNVDDHGMCVVVYTLDNEFCTHQVKVGEAKGPASDKPFEMGEPDNPYHITAPSNGDLWIMHIKPGDRVRAGEEVCNIAIMKQEKAILAVKDGTVKRVLKTANYEKDRKMVPVKMGELLVELGPPTDACPTCRAEVMSEEYAFCPKCGQKLR
jgi:pyruvate carboxylase